MLAIGSLMMVNMVGTEVMVVVVMKFMMVV